MSWKFPIITLSEVIFDNEILPCQQRLHFNVLARRNFPFPGVPSLMSPCSFSYTCAIIAFPNTVCKHKFRYFLMLVYRLARSYSLKTSRFKASWEREGIPLRKYPYACTHPIPLQSASHSRSISAVNFSISSSIASFRAIFSSCVFSGFANSPLAIFF